MYVADVCATMHMYCMCMHVHACVCVCVCVWCAKIEKTKMTLILFHYKHISYMVRYNDASYLHASKNKCPEKFDSNYIHCYVLRMHLELDPKFASKKHLKMNVTV